MPGMPTLARRNAGRSRPAPSRGLLRCLTALLAVLGLAGQLAAADAAGDLRRLVRADVGLCLELHDLRTTLPDLLDSPLAKRLRDTSFYREWLDSDDYRKLAHAERALQAAVGKPFVAFAKEVFGESVVLAVYATDAEEPSAVLLVRAADAASLDEALQTWNRGENAEAVPTEHRGIRYFRRTREREEGDEVQFYLHDGSLLALSDREAMIRQVIDLLAVETDAERLIASDRYLAARDSLPERTAASLYFNPRAWDAALREEVADPSQKSFATFWRSCESIAVGLRTDQGLIAEAVIRYDGTAPARWRDSLGRTAGPATFLSRVPRQALLVFAGRMDFGGAGRLALAGQSAAEQAEWRRVRPVVRGLLAGRDLVEDVLPQLGPNWGAYVVPRAEMTADGVPVDLVVSIELAARGTSPTDDVRPAIENALKTGLNLLAVFHNSQGAEAVAVVRDRPEGDGTLYWVADFGPWEPSFLLSDGDLILASSPAPIREHLALPPEASLASAPRFSAWAGEFFPAAGQVFFVNAEALRTFLARNREALVDQAVNSRSLPRDEAGRRIDRFAELASLFNGVFAAARVDEREIRLVLGGVVAVEMTPAPADGAPADR